MLRRIAARAVSLLLLLRIARAPTCGEGTTLAGESALLEGGLEEEEESGVMVGRGGGSFDEDASFCDEASATQLESLFSKPLDSVPDLLGP